MCEITEALRLPQYQVSRHLSLLREAGIVVGRQQGKWRHYGLNAAMSAEEEAIVAVVCECAAREPGAQQDVRCLEQHLRPRENGQMVDCPS